jgi:hypothetical protein
MGKRIVRRADPELCLAVLEPHDRATVIRWARIVGLEWSDVPPLRAVVEMVSVLLLSGDMPGLSAGDAVRASAEALGLADDDERATHPADRYSRTLLNWQKRAANGNFFRSFKTHAE